MTLIWQIQFKNTSPVINSKETLSKLNLDEIKENSSVSSDNYDLDSKHKLRQSFNLSLADEEGMSDYVCNFYRV